MKYATASAAFRKQLGLAAAVCLAACARPDAATRRAEPSRAEADGAKPASGVASRVPSTPSDRASEREAMVDEQIAAQGVRDPRVLAALRRVPRHRFVLPEVEQLAYAARPLPIPGGQTISQPYIVAFMSEAAEVSPSERCLEIGTGSGYQAAVLAELCSETYSIEYLPEVAAFGRRNLENAGYAERVALRVGDGYGGWPERAPFDAIIVTAAPEAVPQPLLDQLAPAGKLVIPIGPENGHQRLERWTRRHAGATKDAFARETLLGVRFVPFLGPSAR